MEQNITIAQTQLYFNVIMMLLVHLGEGKIPKI